MSRWDQSFTPSHHHRDGGAKKPAPRGAGRTVLLAFPSWEFCRGLWRIRGGTGGRSFSGRLDAGGGERRRKRSDSGRTGADLASEQGQRKTPSGGCRRRSMQEVIKVSSRVRRRGPAEGYTVRGGERAGDGSGTKKNAASGRRSMQEVLKGVFTDQTPKGVGRLQRGGPLGSPRCCMEDGGGSSRASAPLLTSDNRHYVSTRRKLC